MEHNPIYLDGVDVSNCGFIHPEISKTQCHIALAFSDQYEECTNCEQIEDCYFKQLARKTQECEHWKLCYEQSRDNNKSIIKTFVETSEKDIDRYRKALEEIEKELKEDVYCESQECGCDDFEECLNCVKTQILDIINKAKEEE